MRLKNIPGSREKIAESEYVIKEDYFVVGPGVCREAQPGVEKEKNTPKQQGKELLPVVNSEQAASNAQGNTWTVKGRWHEVFGNEGPVHIEIGMGKGTFLMELARRNPEINYVGIEKYSSVLLRAIQKQEEKRLPNVRFIRMDAEYICAVFDENEVSKIYLNFSDPWPKDRHAKRRLTSREFLRRYSKILKSASSASEGLPQGKAEKDYSSFGIIEFKTDNKELFDFSLEEAREADWPVLAYTYDLHSNREMMTGNIMTEYEKKFSALGQKICKMIIKKP